ncbi:hypothetical protein HYH03_008341 [Edaphochlamys debaryana]|uniref:Uncharacterized protein n=1 Tax=Edaphochlamys debaryana TaxID=47281 RepID=A0A836BZ26_9CHLO|nr:hypothetical protein HYH03_008341 [Edaphochlamys debaryana]|eukprot:KAG2493527.1 hypothetical protein HYH03_008341 [Edaphochlamys debaryana]
MDSAGTAWHAVKYGNLEMITRLFPSQCNVYSKGPVGENVFHIAMLLNTPSTLAIAKYLVKLYGKTLVNTPYQERKAESDPPGQYEGETALHIAIVNHDFDMVKFLVQNGADSRARAYGSFFQPGSAVYYGEYPLSFAACTGQKDIVSYLKRHGARVNHDRDQWGNTALHMCVYHDQPDMYDHLVEYCGASEHVQNNRSQTPLLLAASLGKVEMLQHIYNKRRRVAWAYGPVTSYSLSLREIDTVQNQGEYVPSAIETSVRKGHLEVLGDPLVQTLLQTKWQRFGKATFLCQVAAYLVWVVSQTFLVWLQSDTKLWNSKERFAMEVMGVVLGGSFFAVEVLDFAQWTMGVYRRRKLMKAVSKYRPPLYPIPGERLETVTTQKSNFLTRLIASNRQNTQQAVAEGTEDQEAATADAAESSRGPALALALTPASCSGRAALAALPEGEEGQAGDDWRLGEARGCGGRASAGPVAEGTEGPSTSGGGITTPFATAASLSLLPSGSGPGQPGPELGPGLSSMQQLYHQLAAGACAPGGGGAGGGMAALQQQVASLQQMRTAYAASAGGAGSASFTAAGAAAAAALGSSQMGGFNSLSMTGHVAMSVPEPVDFVSVGLGPGPVGLPGGLMGGPKAAFGGAAVGQSKVTSMLRGPDAPAASTQAEIMRDGPPARMSNPSLQGLNRVPSLGGSLGDGEIRNRMRGGGGDNVGGSTLPRATTRRQTTNIGGGGGDGEPPDGATAAGGDEEPQVDRTPACLRHVKTLLHAYRGYLKRMVRDPIQFVHVFHNCATLVHFVIWASCYGGVGGSGSTNVKLIEFDDVVVSLMALSGWMSVLYYSRGHQSVGQLMVIVERCSWEVVKFACLFFIADIGFTLAFYTCSNGMTSIMLGESNPYGGWDPMKNIGYGMIQLVRFMYGEMEYDPIAVNPAHPVKTAFATMFFIFYVGTVLLLLCNVLIAMIVHVYTNGWGSAEKQWRLRWAQYVLRAEARMPMSVQQRFRLGEVSYDAILQTRVYNHVFEVEEEQVREEEREAQIKALEAVLDKQRSGGKREVKRPM